jgi:hypothetical protein
LERARVVTIVVHANESVKTCRRILVCWGGGASRQAPQQNNTSIYVTYGVGSRFFSNFNTNAELFYSKKLKTRINGNLVPGEGICNFNTRFPGGPEYRTENSRDTLRGVNVGLYSAKLTHFSG